MLREKRSVYLLRTLARWPSNCRVAFSSSDCALMKTTAMKRLIPVARNAEVWPVATPARPEVQWWQTGRAERGKCRTRGEGNQGSAEDHPTPDLLLPVFPLPAGEMLVTA